MEFIGTVILMCYVRVRVGYQFGVRLRMRDNPETDSKPSAKNSTLQAHDLEDTSVCSRQWL